MKALSEMAYDWPALLLVAAGLSMTAWELAGGLVFAAGLGSLIARQRKDPRKLWVVMVTALLVAVLSALASQKFDHFGFPPQLIMGVAGGLSGWVMNVLIGVLGRIEDRAADVADRAIDRFVPGDEE